MSVKDLDNKRVGMINSLMRQVHFTQRDFEKAVKNAYGKNPDSDIMEDLDGALKSPGLVYGDEMVDRNGNPIDENVLGVLRTMRAQVKALSTEMVALGIVDGDLAITVLDNADSYLTRSYRVHTDKDWIDRIEDTEVWSKGMTWRKDELSGLSESISSRIIDYEKRAVDAKDRFDKFLAKHTGPLFDTANSLMGNPTYQKHARAIRFWNTKLKEAEGEYDRVQSRMTPDNLNADLTAMLKEQQDSFSNVGIAKSGQLGKKAEGILKRRQNIPQPLRDLFGEYRDPIMNYSQSIYKMAHLIQNAKFLAEVEKAGIGKFLFTEPTGQHTDLLASEESKTMAPLNGYYTTPDLKRAFEEYNESNQDNGIMGDLFRSYIFLVSRSKYAKTILSPVTHMRNFNFNIFFHWANGRTGMNLETWTKEVWPVIKSDVAGLENLSKGTSEQKRAAREKVQKLIELGVFDESVTFKEMMQLMKDSKRGWEKMYNPDSSWGRGLRGNVNNFLKFQEEMYQAEDNAHKYYAFLIEANRYSKALYGKPYKDLDLVQQREMEQKAASIVRNTMPTYSMVSENIKAIRTNPFVGTFVSFPYEVLRTTKNSVAQMIEDVSDPRTRSIGYKRMLGLASVNMITLGAAVAAARFLAGMSDDDEDAIRWFLPPWSSDSVIIPIQKEGPDFSYIDVTSVVPQGYIFEVLNAGLNTRENAGERMASMAGRLTEPFVGTDMTTKRIAAIMANRKEGSGAKIFSEDQPGGFSKVFAYGAEVFEPGFLTTGRRIYKSVTDPELDYFGKMNPHHELLALFPGVRVSVSNVEGSFRFRATDLGERKRETRSIYTRERKKQRYSAGISGEEQKLLDSLKNESVAAYRNMMKDAIQIFSDGVQLGANPSVLRDYLGKAGFNGVEINNIEAGIIADPVFDDDINSSSRGRGSSRRNRRRRRQKTKR